MKALRYFVPMIALIFTGLNQSVVQATEPQEIFDRCVAQIREMVTRCKGANEAVVHECVPQIRELLAQGHRDAARALAERCILKIKSQSAACIDNIRRHCEECVHRLRELGAFELADRLNQVCRQAVIEVAASRDRAIAVIRSLF